MILVTGATGNVGSELVAQLAAEGVAVRAMTRSPEKANLPTGIEVVAGDFDKPETLPAALAGVERVFVVPPGYGPEGPVQETTLVAAARKAGVKHLVKLSTSGVGFGATDPLSSGHRAGERVVQESGMEWTILRPGTFMVYLHGYADTIGKERTMYVTEGDPVSAMIHPRDIASVAAKVLTASGHESRAYTLTGGEALSPQRQGEIIGEALGRQIKVVERTTAETQAEFDRLGWGGPRLDALLELKRQSAAWDWKISDSVQKITGTAPLTLRTWVDENLHIFR
ncbi:nucleotide-diphosphate-sugar epimerase [Streptomyces nigrescens]|uniref:Nucleotide-diphosphate-sugar epimerase n=2 Tax=Streptomyces TaxID=1883 RepID=A0ABN6QWA4_STRNI|nr:SDR family oxidoreductase [Streptomyces nigrescens]MEE4417989.1 SDR family oxidoreductase [Streptomyces sp. DSM 41528]BDM69672.1 nucleotide-diphosphate-sugar epimerase [Streptomyces nigrescens]